MPSQPVEIPGPARGARLALALSTEPLAPTRWICLAVTCLAGCAADPELGSRQQALSWPAPGVTSVTVKNVGVRDAEGDYLPHVIACENGAAEPEALKAQAVAARTYMFYKVSKVGYVVDGTSDQVYSCATQPQQKHYDAVSATTGQVLVWNNTVICSFFVAGAKPTSSSCVATSSDSDPTNTEKYVTYNQGAVGSAVKQSPLGWVSPSNPENRGCFSQNGSRCLYQQGYSYSEMLHFYYGADVEVLTASGYGPVTPTCGNGQLDAGELCDPEIPAGSSGACPTSCDDGDPCTSDRFVGSGCQVTCSHTYSCSPTPQPSGCGNGKLEAGEWCDPAIPAGIAGSCPTSCDDGDPCTADRLSGSGCLAICSNPRIADCGGGTTQPSGQPLGSACSGNADCLTGLCLPAYNGYSGGLCSQPCTDVCSRAAGDPASACIQVMQGLGGYCFELCDASAAVSGCRAGYSCVTRDTADGLTRSVCVSDTSALPGQPGTPYPDDNMQSACNVGHGRPSSVGALLLLAVLLVLARRRSTRSPRE
jgi:hypothetical protein